ncbi:PLP-dependent transferase [Polyplosphaeria fusca]|uniref:PLP-dependent transferase n=1 Tax=Polyplosphaeria fusca TaxID=682080 RepID=A0A9P4V5L2_9PLEO|nr:PLP-dependent transferase [Polyplosphaeria fusca]
MTATPGSMKQRLGDLKYKVSSSQLIKTIAGEDDTQDESRLAYNARIEKMRVVEYPMLGKKTYLDHAGTTLTSKSLMSKFTREMTATIMSNPHSAGDRQNQVLDIINGTRLKVLNIFNADPEKFDVVFVANATAGIKLVLEAFTPRAEGFEYYYHRDSHTSLVGPRELAFVSQCFASDEDAEAWLRAGDDTGSNRPKLFAYPGQSNMNGRRLPLSWPSKLRSNKAKSNAYSLFDAAALITTGQLNLSDYEAAPDFVVMSFYKVFGFPDLGALIVRKPAGQLFDKRMYFGGGTTEMMTVFGKPWHARKEKALHSRLEDGTPAIRSILALSCAIDTHAKLFSGESQISKHTAWLSKCLHDRLAALKHANGAQVCHVYKDSSSTYGDPRTQGATVAFNIRNSLGAYVGSTNVGATALDHNILIRAGSLCNPGGMFNALGLKDGDIENAFANGFRCNQLGKDVYGGVAYGMVRASLGAMTTLADINVFVKFIENTYVEDRAAKDCGETFVGSQPIVKNVNSEKPASSSAGGSVSKVGDPGCVGTGKRFLRRFNFKGLFSSQRKAPL